MRYSLILSVLLLLPASLYGQQTAMPEADSLRAAGDFGGAVAAYRTVLAESVAGDRGQVAYRLASTFALAGQFPDSAFAYLELALQDDQSVAPLYDPDLYFLIDDPRWADLEARQLDHLAERVGDGFDREYARVLLSARMKEWAYRWHIMFGFRSLGPNSPVLSALAHAMQEHHSENETSILGLLDSKGWPTHSAVGEEAAYAAGNLITHADLETRQRYLPMLEAACEAGEADWSDYAHVLDRTELELGNPQVFGTQMAMNEETGVYEAQPMIEPDRVEQRRAAKGMSTLVAQLEKFNAAMKRDFGG